MLRISCSAAAASTFLQKIRRLAYALRPLPRHHRVDHAKWCGASHPRRSAMEAKRFDTLTRVWSASASRRAAVRFLGVPILGSVFTLLGMPAVMATQTLGDCLHNGVRCTVGTDCCSGWCKRKRGSRKKFCRAAPDQSICTIESNVCATSGDDCDAAGIASCTCYVTSRGFSFCGQTEPFTCFDCRNDADCADRPGVGPSGRPLRAVLGVLRHQ
jgi:hypothetical protein